MPRGTNAPKLWPAEPVKCSWIVSSGKPVGPVLARHLAAGDGADDAVDVADRQRRLDLLAALERRLAQRQDRRHVQRRRPGRGPAPRSGSSPTVRRRRRAGRGSSRSRGPAPSSDRRPASSRCSSVRPIISLMVRKPSWAISSRTSCATKRMKLTTWSGVARELLAQLRVLRGHADRAGVEVADAHHDAAERHQRRRREAELLGAQQRRRRRRRGRSSAGRRSRRRCGCAGC